MVEFEPKIIGFLCNWCSYAGADLAGVSRFQYPPNIRIVRVMCSGRVDPVVVLEAFIQGADGVFIGGCHPGDCHYQSGNYQAERKMKMVKKLLNNVGFQAERLRLEWVSASEGSKFAEVISEFTNQIKSLGSSRVKEPNPDQKLREALIAAKNSVSDFRLRALVSKERLLVEEGNVYGEKKEQTEFDKVLNGAISAEYIRNSILNLTKEKPLSVKEIAGLINLKPQEVLQHVVVMRKKNLLGMATIEGQTPKYLAQLQGVAK